MPIGPLVVSPMSADDLPAVMEIERSSFRHPWTPGLFLHELKLPFSRCRVLRPVDDAAHLAGYAIWWVVAEESELLNIAVHSNFRQKGAGRQLLAAWLADATAAAAEKLHLEVSPDNDSARKLYESAGFSVTGQRKNYYAQGEHALILSRSL